MWLNKPPLGAPLDWSNPLNDGLVLHLAMNEGHGNKVYDLSGHGNHGTLKNFAFPSTVDSGWNPGRKGDALQFDGVNDYVDCGNNESLNIIDAITIESWIKPASVTTHHQIVKNGYDHNIEGTRLGYISALFKGYWQDTVNGLQYVRCDTNPLLGKWSHTALVLGDEGKTKMYINGVVQGDVKDFNGVVRTATPPPTEIGRHTDQYFNGTIDEVRIYHRALSAAEIRERYINPWGVYLDEED